jgi:sugar-specific transcriptional regulator TrmB
LVADTLEAILHGEGDGLSAVTIAERSNASYGQVLNLLRELESAGQVRRTGTRRSTRWRLITDEERIAERAAELQSRMANPGS